jgi:major membrane immunogen (membrane-anchored lipoprotein)
MKRIYTILIILAAMLLVSACTANDEGDAIGMRGEVTSITTGERTVILVEGKVEEDTTHDKASVTIKPETKIVKVGEDGTDTAAKPEDIKLFDNVEVVFDGPVAESYPVQGSAKLIRILSE